ncbi:MAG: nuclear transport factor 2 family protein [Actinobacteria bacterium]|nr:nuclear transport factor 2 family protein [Actinomycetota bacterium]MBU1942045.1 nuclear transport factor 2 family protein [Actinomycetota bacterium]MBU2687184.1 nuclear transport factor 2 family protein [Actinomycetota bacterium]
MDSEKMYELADRFLTAWNSQDVDRVAATYTDDVVYRDPNTRGEINGSEDFKRYLEKLFAAWEMTWSLREAYLFEGGGGCSALWHATVKQAGGDHVVDFDGMDLILVRDERIARNEVWFDRAVLATLLQ